MERGGEGDGKITKGKLWAVNKEIKYANIGGAGILTAPGVDGPEDFSWFSRPASDGAGMRTTGVAAGVNGEQETPERCPTQAPAAEQLRRHQENISNVRVGESLW